MRRREFLLTGASAIVASTIGQDALPARDRSHPAMALQQRLADVIATYDSQGNHRTGTPVDTASAEWLARQVQEIGAKAELEPFPLSGLSRIRATSISPTDASKECRYSMPPLPTQMACAGGSDHSAVTQRSGWQKPSRSRSWNRAELRPG